MYHVRAVVDKKYNIYELVDMATNSRVKIAPERGGIIFSYSVGGQELLYLNEETFYHQDQNVRGGIPILFPISGQLNGGTYEWEGTNYTMGNHGFARNAIWEVIDSHTDNRAALTIRLTSNVQTKKAYPFDFEVVFTYSLEKGKLTIHQEYKNKGERPMPISAGFHPYFKTSEKPLAYETDATKYYDYNDGKNKEFTGSFDITSITESVALFDAKHTTISFQPSAPDRKIKLGYGEEFKYVVIWTESGKEFICVEPWMAKNDEFNRKNELVMVNGNEQLTTDFSIKLE
ncbi:aldose epimerase [Neobacillus sp. FSL H8-0543]|uniref:aldose epimerase family protein n=1 Tax=Neobacillus sp. FSL H8-0543 TaxID=2954672 RepID=UPI00315865BE